MNIHWPTTSNYNDVVFAIHLTTVWFEVRDSLHKETSTDECVTVSMQIALCTVDLYLT